MKRVYSLCNPQVENCPELRIDTEKSSDRPFKIVDDDGTSIALHPEHLRQLVVQGHQALTDFESQRS